MERSHDSESGLLYFSIFPWKTIGTVGVTFRDIVIDRWTVHLTSRKNSWSFSCKKIEFANLSDSITIRLIKKYNTALKSLFETCLVNMKIAVVIFKYGLVGGAENFVYELTERLATRNCFEIHVLTSGWRRGKSPINFHKIPTIPFPRFMRPISFAYFANKKARSKDFDLVHSHDRIFQMDLLTMHGVPHKTWVQEARRKPLSLFDRSMAWVEQKGIKASQIKMVLPVSTLVKDELLKLYDIPESKLRVIHPGVSMDRFSALNRESCRYEIRQRHGLSQSDVVVLFVGMNFEIKRLELVVKGVADLVVKGNRNSNLKLLVVGKGGKERYLTLAREIGRAHV